MKKILLFSTVLMLAGTGAIAQEKVAKKQVATEAPKAKRVGDAEALKSKRLEEKKQLEMQNSKTPVAPKPAEASLVDPRSI